MAIGRHLLLLSLLLLTSACVSVPLTTLYKLSRMNPMEADPGKIRIAVRTSDAIQLLSGDVTMKLAYQAEDGGLQFDDVYDIQIRQGGAMFPELYEDLLPHEQITLFELSDDDKRLMRSRQQLIGQQKQQDKKGKGMLTVGVQARCLLRNLDGQALEADIFIQLEPQEPFMLLNEDLDLRKTVIDGNQPISDWPLCDEKH